MQGRRGKSHRLIHGEKEVAFVEDRKGIGPEDGGRRKKVELGEQDRKGERNVELATAGEDRVGGELERGVQNSGLDQPRGALSRDLPEENLRRNPRKDRVPGEVGGRLGLARDGTDRLDHDFFRAFLSVALSA
jgi:hypothetical protein